jgi:ABC-type phosphate transport system substrate-binding protein
MSLSSIDQQAIIRNSLVIKNSVSDLGINSYSIASYSSSTTNNVLTTVVNNYKSLANTNNTTFPTSSSSSITNNGIARSNVDANGSVAIGFTDNIITTTNLQIPIAVDGLAIVYNLDFVSIFTAVKTDFTDSTYTPGHGTNTGTAIDNVYSSNNQSLYERCRKLLSKNPLILDGSTLVSILKGTITRWDDAAIVSLNPDLKLYIQAPKTAATNGKPQKNVNVEINCLYLLSNPTIKLLYRSSGSNTSAVLTSYLNKIDSSISNNNTNLFAALGIASPSGSLGYANSSALISGINTTDGSISYIPYSNLLTSNIKSVARLKNTNGYAVNINSVSLYNSAEQGFSRIGGNTFSLANLSNTDNYYIYNAPGNDSYPITYWISAYALANTTQNSRSTAISKFLIYLAVSNYGISSVKQSVLTKLPPNVKEWTLNKIYTIMGSNVSSTN